MGETEEAPFFQIRWWVSSEWTNRGFRPMEMLVEPENRLAGDKKGMWEEFCLTEGKSHSERNCDNFDTHSVVGKDEGLQGISGS